MKTAIMLAADALLGGGIVTCPTEGVYGLSCMPDNPQAILRLLLLKQRAASQGLILIASRAGQLDDWVEAANAIPDPTPESPTTWLVPARPGVSQLLRGHHAKLAVRITTNPVARTLCDAVASPLVSTSANVTGEPPARNRFVLRRRFQACVDYIVPGDCGSASGPSEIRDLVSGKVLRSSSK